jgi:hypothetical protein
MSNANPPLAPELPSNISPPQAGPETGNPSEPQVKKNLHRGVVAAQDPKDRAQYMIFADTKLGQQAMGITDREKRNEFIVEHGTFAGRPGKSQGLQEWGPGFAP